MAGRVTTTWKCWSRRPPSTGCCRCCSYWCSSAWNAASARASQSAASAGDQPMPSGRRQRRAGQGRAHLAHLDRIEVPSDALHAISAGRVVVGLDRDLQGRKIDVVGAGIKLLALQVQRFQRVDLSLDRDIHAGPGLPDLLVKLVDRRVVVVIDLLRQADPIL